MEAQVPRSIWLQPAAKAPVPQVASPIAHRRSVVKLLEHVPLDNNALDSRPPRPQTSMFSSIADESLFSMPETMSPMERPASTGVPGVTFFRPRTATPLYTSASVSALEGAFGEESLTMHGRTASMSAPPELPLVRPPSSLGSTFLPSSTSEAVPFHMQKVAPVVGMSRAHNVIRPGTSAPKLRRRSVDPDAPPKPALKPVKGKTKRQPRWSTGSAPRKQSSATHYLSTGLTRQDSKSSVDTSTPLWKLGGITDFMSSMIDLRGKREFLSNDDAQNVLPGVLGMWNAKKRVDWMVGKLQQEPTLVKALEDRVQGIKEAERRQLSSTRASVDANLVGRNKAALKLGTLKPSVKKLAQLEYSQRRDERLALAKQRREEAEAAQRARFVELQDRKLKQAQKREDRKRAAAWTNVLQLLVSTSVLAKAVAAGRAQRGGVKEGHDAATTISRSTRGWIVRRWVHAIKQLRGVVAPIMKRYRLRLQARRKARAADMLVSFCKDYTLIVTGAMNSGWPRALRKYYRNVVRCQRLIRSYHACTRARMEALHRMWQKHSSKMDTVKRQRIILEWANRKAQELLLTGKVQGADLETTNPKTAARKAALKGCRRFSAEDHVPLARATNLTDIIEGQPVTGSVEDSRRGSMPAAPIADVLKGREVLDTRSWALSKGELDAIFKHILDNSRQRLRKQRSLWDESNLARPTRIKSIDATTKRTSILGEVATVTVRTFYTSAQLARIKKGRQRNPHTTVSLFGGGEALTLKRLVAVACGVHAADVE